MLYDFIEAGLRFCLPYCWKFELIKYRKNRALMNKADLIQALRTRCNLSKAEATHVMETFFGELASALQNGDRVEIRGFCSLFIKEYAGYTGRNPKTGKQIQVPVKKLPFFKPGKELRERVNN